MEIKRGTLIAAAMAGALGAGVVSAHAEEPEKQEVRMTRKTRGGRILVFDVNETLLDIEVLNPFFGRAFGDPRVMRQWFAELILYSEALSLSGAYTEFGKLAVAVLNMVAKIRHVALEDRDVNDFVDIMRSLPPHPEVPKALERLRSAGFRMVTLTNSSPHPRKPLLDTPTLTHYFERHSSFLVFQP